MTVVIQSVMMAIVAISVFAFTFESIRGRHNESAFWGRAAIIMLLLTLVLEVVS